MATLEQVGISMKEVTETLLADAVKKFSDPFDKLLGSVEQKRQALQSGLSSQSYSLGEFEGAVKKNLEDWRFDGKNHLLWARDINNSIGQRRNDWVGWVVM